MHHYNPCVVRGYSMCIHPHQNALVVEGKEGVAGGWGGKQVTVDISKRFEQSIVNRQPSSHNKSVHKKKPIYHNSTCL